MTKILLVEDDGQIASYLGELLRAEGFDTQIAGSKRGGRMPFGTSL